MKILKIILGIVLGIGVIVGSMFLVRKCKRISTTRSVDDTSFYTELKSEIMEDWKNLSHWNLELYNEEMEKVDAAYSTERISSANYDDLVVDINSSALVAIDKTLPNLLKAKTWDEGKIKKEMSGIDSVAKCPALAEKIEVVRSKAVYKLYHDAKDWADGVKESTVGTYYNGNPDSWKNFNTIVENVENQKAEFEKQKNKNYYNEFLRNKLDGPLSDAVAHVKDLRGAYYTAVANSITSHYKVEEWDNYSNPQEAFNRVHYRLDEACKKLRGEDEKAHEIVGNHLGIFNKSNPSKRKQYN